MTFGLGGAAAVLFLVLAATGALLLVVYEPSPERAYGTVVRLVDEVPFGALVRNAHHGAANGLVLVTGLHLLRAFDRGGHLPPRRGNWFVGLGLLLLVVGCAFTGYLLPWDQLAFWAITISTGMLDYVPVVGGALLRAARGGAEVGPSTLARFFVLHVAILPIALLLLLFFHFWLVRKVGGGDPARRRGRPFRSARGARPHLAEPHPAGRGRGARDDGGGAAPRRDLERTAARPGQPGHEPESRQGPLVLHGGAGTARAPPPGPRRRGGPAPRDRAARRAAGALRDGAPQRTLVRIPAGRTPRARRGRRRRRGDGRGRGGERAVPEREAAGSAPCPRWYGAARSRSCVGVLVLLAVAGLSRRRGASRQEAVQAAFTFALASFAVLTVVGVLFRGPGMALGLP